MDRLEFVLTGQGPTFERLVTMGCVLLENNHKDCWRVRFPQGWKTRIEPSYSRYRVLHVLDPDDVPKVKIISGALLKDKEILYSFIILS
jgi:hypothetical protein